MYSIGHNNSNEEQAQNQQHRKRIALDIPQSSENSLKVSSSSQNEQLLLKLVEVGLDPELIRIAIDAFGTSNESKVVTFVTDFQRLQELPERFPKNRIQKALLMYESDYQKSLLFLKECAARSNSGIQDDLIAESLSLFNYDTTNSRKFLKSFYSLAEFGFSKEIIKEALLMHDNDRERAIQYLLESNR